MASKIGDVLVARAADFTVLVAGVGVSHRIKLGLKSDEIAYIRAVRLSPTSASLIHAVSTNPEKVADIDEVAFNADDADMLVFSVGAEEFIMPDPGIKVGRDLLFLINATGGGAGNHWVTVYYQKQKVTMKEKNELMITRR